MYEAMVGNIIAASIKIYEGESHGFRKEENIQDALDMNIRDG
jgi:dipeptidyl aminopeptidase/acylaminoacyl peptidase